MRTTNPPQTNRAAGEFRLLSRPVIGWALYDFANTIFSFAVISFYFAKWVVEQQDNPDWYLGAMNAVVSVLLVATLPALGAIADRRRLRVQFLGLFTAACVAATAALGLVEATAAALVVGGLAVFCYQCALAQYDPLLADVAPEERRGTVSGLGVGLGYVGVLIGAGVLLVIVGEGDRQGAFLPTALMYGLLSVPALLWVRERRRPVDAAGAREVVRDATRQLAVTARHIVGGHRDVLRFLLARFLYADALLTVIVTMGIYMERVGDFTATQEFVVQALSMVAAAAGGFLAGPVVERRGPRWVLVRILVLAAGALLLAAATGTAGSVWFLGPMVGFALGGVWTSDRVFMLRLSPPSARGEFFSIYNLVGRVSSGLGPLVLWGGTLWLLHERGALDELSASRVALLALAGAAVAGLLIVRGVDDTPRDWSQDALEQQLEEIER